VHDWDLSECAGTLSGECPSIPRLLKKALLSLVWAGLMNRIHVVGAFSPHTPMSCDARAAARKDTARLHALDP